MSEAKQRRRWELVRHKSIGGGFSIEAYAPGETASYNNFISDRAPTWKRGVFAQVTEIFAHDVLLTREQVAKIKDVIERADNEGIFGTDEALSLLSESGSDT